MVTLIIAGREQPSHRAEQTYVRTVDKAIINPPVRHDRNPRTIRPNTEKEKMDFFNRMDQ